MTKTIYEKAIDKWGKVAQILMMLEEMSELSMLLFHSLRENRENPDNWEISEEMADVEIMLEQMKLIFCNKEEIENIKEKKLERLEERLK